MATAVRRRRATRRTRTPPRNVLLAHAAMAFAAVTFGGLNVIAKRALSDGINPYMFGLYRDVLACPLLAAWTTYKKGWRKIATRRDFFLLVACGMNVSPTRMAFCSRSMVRNTPARPFTCCLMGLGITSALARS